MGEQQARPWNLIFIDLRDRDGITQIVFDPQLDIDTHKRAHILRNEWVLAVKGSVSNRLKGQENSNLPTGDIELKVRALKIARTETIAVSNEGALLGYEDSGVVEKSEFYAALDERVCPDCNALHGKVYKLADSHGVIPVHPNCRCVMLPVV